MSGKQTLPWLRPSTLALTIGMLVVLATAPAARARPAGEQAAKPSAQPSLKPEKLSDLLEDARLDGQGVLRETLETAQSKSGALWDKAVADTIGKDKTWQEPEKAAFRAQLVKSWLHELDGALSALGFRLGRSRLAINDQAAGNTALYVALHAHEDSVLASLRGWVGGEVPERLAGVDPSAPGAKATGTKTLSTLANDLGTTFAARWAAATNDIVAKYRDATGDKTAQKMSPKDKAADKAAGEGAGQTTGTQAGMDSGDGKDTMKNLSAEAAVLEARKERFQTQAEEDFLHDLQKDTGFSRIVRCLYTGAAEKPAGLTCAPGLLVNAADIAEIVVRGLPTDREVAVTAVSSEDQASISPGSDLRSMLAVADGSLCPKLEMKKAEKKLSSITDPSCDQVSLPAGASDAAFVSVYKNRRVFPKYGSFMGRQGAARPAFAKLRLTPLAATGSGTVAADRRHRLNLSILVSGGASQVLVCVAPRGASDQKALAPACASIPVGYQRWSVETGGFLAFSKITDRKIIKQPAEDPSKVQILKVTDDGSYTQETGLWLSFVPRNYPGYGLGLGVVSDTSRPVSVYFGPSLRLRTFGHRGLASLTGGFALRSVERYPGLDDCLKHRNAVTCGAGFSLSGTSDDPDSDRVLSLPEQSPLLTASQEYRTGWFVAIQLGFSFGPIPGPPDSE